MPASSRLRPPIVFIESVNKSTALPRLNHRDPPLRWEIRSRPWERGGSRCFYSCRQLAAVEPVLLQTKITVPRSTLLLAPGSRVGHAKYLARLSCGLGQVEKEPGLPFLVGMPSLGILRELDLSVSIRIVFLGACQMNLKPGVTTRKPVF